MVRRTPSQASRGRLYGGGILIAAMLVAIIVILRLQESSQATAQLPVAAITLEKHAPPAAEDPPPTPEAIVPASPPPSLAEQLVGIWHLQKHGERTITIHPDGTATADVRLNMLGALMYGKQLTLDLTWSLQEDVMTQTITSGTPEEAVGRLIRDWGDRREYRVVEASEKQLVLADVDDQTDQEVWTSVEPTMSSPPMADTPATTSDTTQSSP